MANQTEAQVQTEIKNRISIFQELAKFAGRNATGNISNYLAREGTALNDDEGDFSVTSNRELANLRAFLASAIQNSFGRRIIDPLFRNYARAVGNIVETDGGDILRRIYIRAITAGSTIRVKSRNITFGSVAAGSNLGNGTIRRLTVDAYGFDIEACHMEPKRAECTRDNVEGADLNEEVFFFRGATPYPDQLLISGSGAGLEIKSMSARQSFLSNPSFSLFTNTIASPTEISGWTPGSSISNFQLDETNYYRGAGGTSDPTPRALKFVAADNISQLFSVNNVKLDPDLPIYMQIAYNRSVGAADGILTFQVGNVSVSVNLGSAPAGWNTLIIALDKGLFPRNFATTSDPTVKITWSNRTTGTLLVDDVLLVPFTMFNGIWHALVGGSNPFIGNNRDSFTWNDRLAGSDSILQQWFWKLYGAYLPSVKDASENWTDPSV